MIGSLFIITAASGTGKTSLVKQLIETTPKLSVSVSHTTRHPRPGEVDGEHYHFTTVDSFKDGIQKQQFVEYAEVFGNFYGTASASVEALLQAGIDVILEIDWQGALQVKEKFANTNMQPVMIFILPPSISALKQRLSNRGQDSEEVIATRLAGAVTELRQYDKFDYVVINDDFDIALSELKAIVTACRQKLDKQQQKNAELIANLLAN